VKKKNTRVLRMASIPCECKDEALNPIEELGTECITSREKIEKNKFLSSVYYY